MECIEVMNPVKMRLYADDMVSAAIDFMVEKHMESVPVVDREEVFVGLLSGDRIMRFMLPKPVSMMRGKKYMSFIRESREDLLERLNGLRQRPIGDLVDRNVKVAYPDTGLTDTMIDLSEKQHVVPIVERETNKLVDSMAESLGGPESMGPIWWSLALGACLGGNGSLIGAAANVMVAGLGERAGHSISFVRFAMIGLPVMLVTVVIANVYLYLRFFL